MQCDRAAAYRHRQHKLVELRRQIITTDNETERQSLVTQINFWRQQRY